MEKSLFYANVAKKLTYSRIFEHQLICNTTLPETLSEVITLEEKILEDYINLWRRAVALSLLYHKMLNRQVNVKIVERFWDVVPFDNSPLSLQELLSSRDIAVSHFPLATSDSMPGIVQLWIIDNKTYYFSETKEWEGTSYQLAQAMAKKALHADKELKQELAQKWMLTGAVENDSVKRVDLGNKLNLKRNRTWLIPLDSVSLIAPKYQDRQIRSADSLTTAWNHISGEGTKSGGKKPWPKKIDELHLLIGGNINAQMASILLTKTNKIVLWHSENDAFSKEPAHLIKNIIVAIKTKLKIDIPIPEIKFLSSKNMFDAEKSLQKHFPAPSPSKTILFNVTSGNRLMSFAVQSLARLYPNIDLIYRDLDEEEPHKFNLLNYREFPPYLGSITGIDPKGISTAFLYKKSPPKKEKSEDEKIAEFMKNLLSGEST